MATLHALAEGALAPPLEVPLPAGTEYVLPFFTWTPDSRQALFITVSRDHTVLKLNAWDPNTGEVRTLIEETDPSWINEDRYAAPIFIGDGTQFFWLSELPRARGLISRGVILRVFLRVLIFSGM